MLGTLFSKFGSSLGKYLGASLGKYLGRGILSTVGRYAGRRLGNYLEHKLLHRNEYKYKSINVKDGFFIAKAKYGTPIPLVFGQMRIAGQIIWADRIHAKRNVSVTKQHFKARHLTVHKEVNEFEYYANFAMAICEGEITEINRIWCDDREINISQYNFRLYKGGESQLADPLITNLSKNHCATAYRGLAYIVFEQLPLADFDDMIPNLSFEVMRKSNIKKKNSVEDLIKSMIMIPGSGEYVYDTKIQTQSILLPSRAVMSTKNLNCHNHYNVANSIQSLNQLQSTCSNVKWISPVVCWFADNLDAKDCTIKPAIEFKDVNLVYSEEWSVGKYDRDTAREVTKDKAENPVYGGTVNDASIVRYLIEIKKRGLKIMFYPMFFLDVPKKPWRGRVTTTPKYVPEFFQREHGYNEFILHYANLVKDHVDAFVIGSELIGLTKIRDGNKFPAVDELVKLAREVKKVVGKNVLVTYAADWSEYHHTKGGWFNLDPLWASDDIDFVGIDAYFPATDSISSIITPEELKNGWQSGEGYDYYIDYTNNSKHPLKPEYAWKNIRYWWKNTHKNPDGSITQWKPFSKPVWFTEFGFPSIDKATNQPNVFFDPKCIDGGVPRNSNGVVDFAIQRKAIRAFIEYWQKEEYIGQMFLWTWDARPYPAWPHANFWKDGNLWEKGHWVNNKFGAINLSSILLEISNKCDIDIDHIDTDTIDETIEGFVLSNQITALNAINILRSSYFFDICANNQHLITFQKRGTKQEITINSDECVKLSDNNFIEEIEIPKEITLSAINLHFISYHSDYNPAHVYVNNEINSYTNEELIRFPISLTEDQAINIGELILKNAAIEDRVIKFILHDHMTTLRPTDFVILQHTNANNANNANNLNREYLIRIIHTEIKNNTIAIIGIIDNRRHYFSVTTSKKQLNLQAANSYIETSLIILDPPFEFENTKAPFLAIYLRHNSSATLYARLASEINNDWNHITNLTPSNSTARVVDFKLSPSANIFMVDDISFFLVKGYKLDNYISTGSDWQLAIVGEEVIHFQNLEKIEDNLYKISYICRGEMGTEDFITKHSIDEDFIIINSDVNIIPVSEKLQNQKVFFKAANIEQSIIYQNKANKSLEQYIIKQEIIDNKLQLKWITRLKKANNWDYNHPTNIRFTIIIKDNSKIYEYKTRNNEIIIDISSLTLSDDYQISILSNTL